MLEQNDLQAIGILLDEKLEQKLEQKLDEKLDEKFASFEIKMDGKLEKLREDIVTDVAELIENGIHPQLDRHEEEIGILKANAVTKAQMKVALEDLERKIA